MKGAITTIAQGDGSRIVEARQVVVRTQEEWRALWAAHAGPSQPPPVDFTEWLVAAVFAGERAVPGFQIEVVGSRREGMALALLIEERRPAWDTVAAQVLVTPFHIVSLPRYEGEVRFTSSNVVAIATEPAVSGRPRRHTPLPSSTGLEPRVAGALAYLAGPFSGALILGVERTSHFVRFHAWQALLGLGILGVLDVVCLGLAFLLLVVSPAAFWTMLWAAAILGLGWLLAWGACVLQAWRGQLWKLPLVGPYAERWSGVRGQ